MNNREKLKQQIDSIEFSRYFVDSTVTKMRAEAKRKEEKAMKKKTVVKFALAAACFALALVVGISAFPVNKTPETVNDPASSAAEQTADKTPGFTLLLASAAETEEAPVAVEHKPEIVLPMNGFIVTKDVSGLNEEEQAHEHEVLFRGLQSEIDHDNYSVRGGIVSDIAYYTLINKNYAVKAEKPEFLEDIVICCENGKINTGNGMTHLRNQQTHSSRTAAGIKNPERRFWQNTAKHSNPRIFLLVTVNAVGDMTVVLLRSGSPPLGNL